jgi:hypothetical protein
MAVMLRRRTMTIGGSCPDAMANAIASGSATRPTVTPAIASWMNSRGEYCLSAMTDAGAQLEGIWKKAPHCSILIHRRAGVVTQSVSREERRFDSLRSQQ